MDKNKTIFECQCGSELLKISYDTESPYEVDIAFYKFGHQGRGWREKLRAIKHIIKTGTPYIDMVSLSPEDAKELGKTLIESVKKIK